MREFAPLSGSIPQSLKNVVAKALAKLPENRYRTAGEMREDLRRILRSMEVSDFLQTDLPQTQQFVFNEQLPPTQYAVPSINPMQAGRSAQRLEKSVNEIETSIRPLSIKTDSRQEFITNTKIKRPPTVWLGLTHLKC